MACAARYLEARGPVLEHAECVVLDPDALGVSGLRVEHIAIRGEGGGPCLERALRFRPMGAGQRAVLLFEADRMNPDAQAALLKTTEEPPPGTVLFLTAADLSALLPALRSRCRTWRVGPAPAAALARLAAAAGLDEAAWQALAPVLGPELVLALDPVTRQELLGRHGAFQAWLASRGRAAPEWLAPPEGGTLAEQREAGELLLSAALGWAVAAGREGDPELGLILDLAVPALVAANRDLRGNVTPALVFEDLLRRAFAPALPAASRAGGKAIS